MFNLPIINCHCNPQSICFHFKIVYHSFFIGNAMIYSVKSIYIQYIFYSNRSTENNE